MKNRERINHGGSFRLSSGVEVQGELYLNGEATSLDVYSEDFFDTHTSEDIFGVFHDRSKVSLVDCVTLQGPGRGARAGEQYHFSTVFPHFAIFGDEHIGSSDRVIRQVGFTLDDAETLFYDFGAFGSVINARPHMERIVEEVGGERSVDVGDDPLLFYFTGKHEVINVDTLLGRVSVHHAPSFTLPGPSGIHVDNEIKVNLDFETPRAIREVVEGVLDILRFLEIVAGRPQNITSLTLFLEGAGEHPRLFEVYWCMPPRRDLGAEARKAHPADLPIQAGTEPAEFSSVLRNWLSRNDERRSARGRFSRAFSYQNRYDIDRLVGTANMFDILPSSVYPETVALSQDLQNARDNARAEFKSLPGTPERDSVLAALGRIGKLSLKRKVRARAELITGSVPRHFPQLALVVDQAVDCRNYYVHGSEAKIDYADYTDQVQFLTDTLEFIFAASDLIDAGWNIEKWAQRPSSLSHRFGQYRIDYCRQLSVLKSLLGM